MAPAIAVDADGRPMVVWAAGDGADAEIWVSWREAGGWLPPRALSDNATPDISPSVVTDRGRWLVAWSSFRGRAYFPVATTGDPESGFRPPRKLSEKPGSSPRALASRLGFEVMWASPASDGATLIRGSWLRPSGGRAIDLARAANGRFAATRNREGELLLSWIGADRRLVLARQDAASHGGTDGGRNYRLQTIVGGGNAVGRPSAARGDPAFGGPTVGRLVAAPSEPQRYLVFGDSLTEGFTILGGEGVLIRGYDFYLHADLVALQGKSVRFTNAGLGGERTDEGVNRLPMLLKQNGRGRIDAVLLLEGTNDVSTLVDTETIAFNLRTMTELVVDAGLMAFLGLILPRREPGALFGGSQNRRVDEVNERLPRIAKNAGAVLVNTHSGLEGQGHLYSDHLHLTALGYDVLGELWYAGIKSVVLAIRSQLDGEEGSSLLSTGDPGGLREVNQAVKQAAVSAP